jgi:hypothetical protein
VDDVDDLNPGADRKEQQMNAVMPLHIGNLNGRAVRFFPSPRDIPDQPWVAENDLFDVANIPLDHQPSFRGRLLLGDMDVARTIRSGDKIVPIVAHAVAYGFIQAAIEKGYAPKRLDVDYRIEATHALKVAGEGKPDSWYWAALLCGINGPG